jgi:hypothetical protein
MVCFLLTFRQTAGAFSMSTKRLGSALLMSLALSAVPLTASAKGGSDRVTLGERWRAFKDPRGTRGSGESAKVQAVSASLRAAKPVAAAPAIVGEAQPLVERTDVGVSSAGSPHLSVTMLGSRAALEAKASGLFAATLSRGILPSSFGGLASFRNPRRRERATLAPGTQRLHFELSDHDAQALGEISRGADALPPAGAVRLSHVNLRSTEELRTTSQHTTTVGLAWATDRYQKWVNVHALTVEVKADSPGELAQRLGEMNRVAGEHGVKFSSSSNLFSGGKAVTVTFTSEGDKAPLVKVARGVGALFTPGSGSGLAAAEPR